MAGRPRDVTNAELDVLRSLWDNGRFAALAGNHISQGVFCRFCEYYWSNGYGSGHKKSNV